MFAGAGRVGPTNASEGPTNKPPAICPVGHSQSDGIVCLVGVVALEVGVDSSLEGFVQILASNYLPHGYWFYVTGHVRTGKDPRAVDRKLIEKYEIARSRQQRARRKKSGLANLQYVRIGPFFVLLATHGKHRFFADEGPSVRDIRKYPLQIGGYSLTVRRGDFLKKAAGDRHAVPDHRYRVRVQIGREKYRELMAHFLDIATHRRADVLAREFWNVPFEYSRTISILMPSRARPRFPTRSGRTCSTILTSRDSCWSMTTSSFLICSVRPTST